MSIFKKLAVAASLVLCAIVPATAVAAEEVVFLSTEENNEKYIMRNIYSDFAKAAANESLSITDYVSPYAGGLTNGGFTLPDEGIIIVAARTAKINTDVFEKLKDAMKTKPRLKFIIITESGGSLSNNNKAEFSEAIREVLNWDEAHITHLPNSN